MLVSWWKRYFLIAGMVASLLGVFVVASIVVLGYSQVVMWPTSLISSKQIQPPYEFSDSDQSVLAEARERIKDRSQDTFAVQLLGEDGEPLSEGLEIDYRMYIQDFGWGTFDGASPGYGDIWGKRRNKAYTLGIWNAIYRDDIDMFDFREAEVFTPTEWRLAVGMEVAWHNVAWIVDKTKNDPEGELRVPRDLKDQDFAEQRRRLLVWVREAAEYTDGRYDIVNVFNEPLNKWSDPYHWGDQKRRELLEDVVRTFRAHNRTSQIQISIGEALTATDGDEADWLLSWVRARDLPIDRVALQTWCNGYFTWGEPMPTLTLTQLHDRLERLSLHGYPLDLTEFQAPAIGSPQKGWAWSPERQARWTEAVATVAFSMPGVESFCYFRSRNDFMQEGGFLNAGDDPAETANRLMALIDSFASSGRTVTDRDGRVTLTGHAGRYIVTPPESSPMNGKRWIVAIDADKDSASAVKLESVPKPAPASIANLGPVVTADHYLDVSLIPAADKLSDLGPQFQDAMARVMPLRWDARKPGPKEFKRHRSQIDFAGWRQVGFCFDQIPAEVTRVVVELEIPDRGVDLELNVFDRTRRYSDAALSPGRYRMTIPVGPESRPAVHLIIPYSERLRYKTEQGRLPAGSLTGAWFITE